MAGLRSPKQTHTTHSVVVILLLLRCVVCVCFFCETFFLLKHTHHSPRDMVVFESERWCAFFLAAKFSYYALSSHMFSPWERVRRESHCLGAEIFLLEPPFSYYASVFPTKLVFLLDHWLPGGGYRRWLPGSGYRRGLPFSYYNAIFPTTLLFSYYAQKLSPWGIYGGCVLRK